MKYPAIIALMLGVLLPLTVQVVYAASASAIGPVIATVSVPLADSTEDDVALNGELHVVVGTSSSSNDVRIHANLAEVSGAGSTSGMMYNAVGASSIILHNVADPYAPPEQTFSFDLISRPPSPCVDSTSCGADNTSTISPLDVTFRAVETEPGNWSVNVSCVAVPPSPCMGSSGQ
jgi:hypothetical protein